MRFDRLVIEAGEHAFSLDLHPRLTVIAGVGRLEREGLVNELVGAMGSSRPGVHLEFSDDTGRQLAAFRPSGARHLVVDIDRGTDVSAEFIGADQGIDLLGPAGLDQRAARRIMRVTAADLAATTQGDECIQRLAGLDQHELWRLAHRVIATEQTLQHAADSVGSAPEDAEIVARIEARHAEFEAAMQKHERVRRTSFLAGAGAALSAVPATMALGLIAGAPLLIAAAIVTGLSFRTWKHTEQARAEADQALEEAGAQSYLGFHIQRVNGLLSSEQHRRVLLQSAEAHRAALEAWTACAGDVPVGWALGQREEIYAAARLRQEMSSLGALSSTAPAVATDRTNALAHALVARLSALRSVAGGSSLPLIFDDAVADLEPSMKPALLELLCQASGHQQIIVLTDDEDVASWARLERMTGELAVFEPAGETADRRAIA